MWGGAGGSGGLDRWFYLMCGDWLGCGTRRDGLAANNSKAQACSPSFVCIANAVASLLDSCSTIELMIGTFDDSFISLK